MSSQQSDSNQVVNPYVGPRSFTRDQFKWFKGRNRESGELLSLLLARRLVLFYAQSGAGKTSLLRNEDFIKPESLAIVEELT